MANRVVVLRVAARGWGLLRVGYCISYYFWNLIVSRSCLPLRYLVTEPGTSLQQGIVGIRLQDPWN